MTVLAGRGNLQFQQVTVGQLPQVVNDLAVMVGHQPAYQLAFDGFPVFHAEFLAPMRPPFMNALVANQIAAIEESTMVSAPEVPLAPVARLDAKQAQSVFDMHQLTLDARHCLAQILF